MKAKIEMCYGKQDTDKFKASDNWLQRFKKRQYFIQMKIEQKKGFCK